MRATPGLGIEEKCHWHLEVAKENGAFHDVDGPLDTPCIHIDYSKAPGICDSMGYPNIRAPRKLGGSAVRFTRFIYSLYYGDPIDLQPGISKDSLVVRHRCDRPQCVNPLHLEKGSFADNTRDCIDRGRFSPCDKKGEKNGNSRLKEDDVVNIRNLYNRGGMKQDAIGKMYGIRQAAVSAIILGKKWKHIKEGLPERASA